MNNDNETVYIYALIDPRDERVFYVGQTKNPARRLRQHLADKSISNRRCVWLGELISLGKKPIMKVIEECQKGTVDEREVYYIAHYRNLNQNLLNISSGGAWQGTRTISDEGRKKISDSNKGRTFTDEHKKKLSDSKKGCTFTDEHKKKLSDSKKGCTRSDEHKKKLSDSLKGKPNPLIQKPVAQYTLDGIFIQQFPSGKEASEKTGIDTAHISMCANNRLRQAGGFLWKKVVGDALMFIEPVRPRLAKKYLRPKTDITIERD